MKNEQDKFFNISLSSADIQEAELTNDEEIDEIERYEENEDIYKWLSVLLMFIWVVSLMVF